MSKVYTLEEGLALRKQYLAKAKRVVVKVGSAVLTNRQGLDCGLLQILAEDLFSLGQGNREVILVSSGAVAAGRMSLGLGGKCLGLKEKQAVAAVGQSSLMQAYENAFAKHGKKVAQVLLTHDDFSKRDRYLNMRNTLFTLLEWGILPIINENDTVSVKELRFGDNDTLAAMLASLIDADIFICLTDVEALFTANPVNNPEARPVRTVSRVDAGNEAMAGNEVGALGTGGMQSKIRAARMVAAKGAASFIGPGKQPGILESIFAGAAVGTFFLPSGKKLAHRKHWIAYTLRPKGELILDDGACKALKERGTSLLPAGIIEVRGTFAVGDAVLCVDRQGVGLAVGLVNYAAEEIKRIRGRKTTEIAATLGYCDSDEVIHRDNLVLL
ncbi:MAG: glutamate 5-kinase [Deltaproteobacteria bacterium]